MPDLTTMPVLDALDWYETHRGADLGAAGVRVLVEHGITDTDTILRLAGHVYLLALDIPDMPIDEHHLTLLGVVGARVMQEDRENAGEWALVARRYGLDADAIDPYLDAGRGPGTARLVCAHLHVAGTPFADAGNYDLMLPWDELVPLLNARLTTEERDRWAAIGVGDATAIAMREGGLNVAVAEAAYSAGVRQEKWVERFAKIPASWLTLSWGGERPEDYTLDVLERLAMAGWADTHTVSGALKAIRVAEPWRTPLDQEGGLTFTAEQALRLADAGMVPDDAGRFFTASAGKGRRHTPEAPPQLLPGYLRGHWNTSRTLPDKVFDQMVLLWRAKVRAGHLTDYRWGGCHTYQQILDAISEGIDPRRVKYLRDRYGKATQYRGLPPRIHTYEELLGHHRSDTRQEK